MPSISRTCLHCLKELLPRFPATGRPTEYCDIQCRQAAYRSRRSAKPADGAARAVTQAEVVELAEDLIEQTRQLIRTLGQPEAQLADCLGQALHLDRLTTALTAGLVGHARQQRVPWQELGKALAMRPDTARRTYSPDAIRRRLQNTVPAQPPRETAEASTWTEPPRTPRSHLAPVLLRLQRASGISLRSLADRIAVSPSLLSRILSGERFPNWQLTERLTRACGADPIVLRKVWEDEKIRQDRSPIAAPAPGEPPPRALRTALHTLYLTAGQPTPHTLAETSNALNAQEITSVLAGSVPHWPVMQSLVHALNGDPTYFRPVWEAAAHASTAAQPYTALPIMRTNSPSPAKPTTPSRSAELLLERFSPVLSQAAFDVTTSDARFDWACRNLRPYTSRNHPTATTASPLPRRPIPGAIRSSTPFRGQW